MKSMKLFYIFIAALLSVNIAASEMTVELKKSFFPKKDIIIDADSPDEIIVNYDLNYSISDGCGADIITTYQLGGCPFKKYRTYRKESKYIVNIKNSSARKGKGPQTIRLQVKQKKRDSFDIVPVVTVIDGAEDKITVKDSWFSKPVVTLTARDEVINDSHLDEKAAPNLDRKEEKDSGKESSHQ